jgi:hypothetical protein
MEPQTIRRLTEAEAREFALMILAGAPVADIVPYFWVAHADEQTLIACEQLWPQQPEVQTAIEQLAGGDPWHKLSDEARWELALKKHYSELAYILWTTNYAEAEGPARTKADTCRTAIEAKVSGMAGRESPLAQFYHDLLVRYDTQKTTVQ